MAFVIRQRESPVMLLNDDTAGAGEPNVWTARAWLDDDPDRVLRAMTDPAAIARWAPVRFEADGLTDGRLAAGNRERVTGSIAGIAATFVVEKVEFFEGSRSLSVLASDVDLPAVPAGLGAGAVRGTATLSPGSASGRGRTGGWPG
jgi:hypothetical protein